MVRAGLAVTAQPTFHSRKRFWESLKTAAAESAKISLSRASLRASAIPLYMKIRNLTPFSSQVRMAFAPWMLLLLLLLESSSLAAETAYAALRVVAKRHGNDALNRIVEVSGSKGTWSVLLNDRQEPSQLREVRVRDGKIVNERNVPKTSRLSAPINVNKLNLDSDGALTTLEVALGERVREPEVTYSLTTGIDNATPVWTAKVRGDRNADGTTVQISAATGSVLTNTASAPPLVAEAPIDEARQEDESRRKGGASSTRRKTRTSVDIPDEIVDGVERAARRPVRVLRRFLPF
jgi:hypothetical protein